MPEKRNIRLVLSYDGTNYAGWQIQPSLPTVQGVLEEAIHGLTGESIRVLSAGRTDSGVHAIGQVASFFTSSPIPPEKWRPALQSQLPPEIVIRSSDEVPPEFHATFSAVSKRYRYIIHNSIVDDPFTHRYSWRISQPLDAPAMHTAAQVLVGKHDFRSFESDWPNKATSVRTVTHLSIRRSSGWELWSELPPCPGHDESPGPSPAEDSPAENMPYVFLEIEADGFLYNMVRAITGTLVNVGRGTWTKEDVQHVLQSQDRNVAGATAPACGLFLVRVNYP